MPKMTWKALKELIEKDGWFHVRTNGSHQHYEHPTKPDLVTLSPHRLTDMVPFGTLNSILKKAGLK